MTILEKIKKHLLRSILSLKDIMCWKKNNLFTQRKSLDYFRLIMLRLSLNIKVHSILLKNPIKTVQ